MEDIKVPPFTPSELADDGNSSPSPDAVKHTANGVTLIPRPSNDPRDPLVGFPRQTAFSLLLLTFNRTGL